VTRSVVPTFLICPMRPMIWNSAQWLMVLSCLVLEGVRLIRGSPSVTPKKPGREPALHPRFAWAGASGGPRRAAILSREEFAEGEGENRWTERLRGRPAGLGVSKPRGSPGEAAIVAGGGQEGL